MLTRYDLTLTLRCHLGFIIHVTPALGMLWLSKVYYIYGMGCSGVQHGVSGKVLGFDLEFKLGL